MTFEDVWHTMGPLPYTNEHRCRLVYELIKANGMRHVLELGTAYGKMTCVMAAAISERDLPGQIWTVDLEVGREWQKPPLEDSMVKLGLAEWITPCREKISYNWWLIQRIKEQSLRGHCVPEFDLIFLDGAHNIYTDSGAFFMAEKLLRPGGILLMDDLHWAHKGAMAGPIVWGHDTALMSEVERNTPHVKLLWEYLVQQHPQLEAFLNLDNWWVMCRKKAG